MKRDASGLIAPLLATVLLAVMLVQTRSALLASGTWRHGLQQPRPPLVDPYAPLDRLIADVGGTPAPQVARDPFSITVAATTTTTTHVVTRVVPPPPPPKPLLTSIVWDNDPRATVRWNGRDFSVRENALFADFRVVSINREQVLLERGGERIVLTLPKKGE